MKIAQNHVRKYLTSFFVFSALAFVPGAGFCQAKEAVKKVQQQVGDREDIKRNFHKAVDAVDEDAINEKVDQIADFLPDRDKLKAVIDQIADSRDEIKGLIDEMANYCDRDKVKEVVAGIVQNIDKDSVKRQFDNKVDQVADALQAAYGYIQDELNQYGSNFRAIQSHLNQYNWKSAIPDKATSEVATLSDLKLNGHKKVVIARPGEQIKGEVICDYNRDACSALRMYRVVLGLKNQEGQTTVGNHLGLRAGKELESFTLVAPKEPGIYQVAFKTVQAALETSALHEWNEHNNEKVPTIGLIIVR